MDNVLQIAVVRMADSGLYCFLSGFKDEEEARREIEQQSNGEESLVSLLTIGPPNNETFQIGESHAAITALLKLEPMRDAFERILNEVIFLK